MNERPEPKRVVIGAKVSPESAEGWKGFCKKNAISFAALLEAAGCVLSDEPDAFLSSDGHDLVGMARKIDNDRRARK